MLEVISVGQAARQLKRVKLQGILADMYSCIAEHIAASVRKQSGVKECRWYFVLQTSCYVSIGRLLLEVRFRGNYGTLLALSPKTAPITEAFSNAHILCYLVQHLSRFVTQQH